MAAGGRTPACRAQVVARIVDLRPLVLAAMRESVPDELQGFGHATSRQLQALAHLPRDGMTMGELAAFLRVTGAAASVLGERLVSQGLAVRLADPCDRRVVRLAPTPAGMSVAARYRDNQCRAVAALLDRLTDDQVAAWLDIMETLAADRELARRATPANPGRDVVPEPARAAR